MEKQFPRTIVGGKSVSRMLIGTNWMLGYSHRTPSADRSIRNRYSCPEAFLPMFEAYLQYGIDTVMAPMDDPMVEAVKYAEDKLGKKIIMIDTPQFNVDNNEAARREAEARIKKSAKNGCDFLLIHHASAEQLVNKNLGIIDRLDDYTKMIRDAGMIPGLSAHMPELITYTDNNGYDIETYIQIFNCMGFLMQVEIETVASIIQNAKKPVMNIKSMAAGRVTPYVGLTFNWNVLRDCDMLTLGAFTPDEVHEDVEISFAALEHRFPNLEKRASPVQNQAAFG
ncbi:MAG: hypothetical protein IJF56_02710 [Clostridia bacterium]|nr:hypothetical protein [Clostridia bacterium]